MGHIHFIAIGGSAMHNLAIALHKKGYHVTGSDDEIFEPSRSRLTACGLLPENQGWFPDKLTENTEAVILGMHAMADNPELARAKLLNLKIFSYPEYLYEQTKDKLRIVVGGSHGKTTITSMIMHVMKFNNVCFDYMVGAQVEGFDTMVNLEKNSRIAVFEGDEYLSSTLDPRPKFHLYHPNIAIISGIAWDHINVFPTFENYCQQFEKFATMISPGGALIYFENDENIRQIALNLNAGIRKFPYPTHPYRTDGTKTFLVTRYGDIELQVFGEHNLQNINAARLACHEAGIDDEKFYAAISCFKGAAKRLQILQQTDKTAIFLDFAHSPSKLEATIKAVKMQYPERKLIACMELHTFSSLNATFLPHYKGTMNTADMAMVYYNPETIRHKRLEMINTDQVKNAFDHPNCRVYNDADKIRSDLSKLNLENANLLLMTSGNFSGIDFKNFSKELIDKQI